jgi:hypothetical protein
MITSQHRQSRSAAPPVTGGLESAKVTFTDDDRPSVAPVTPDDEGPIELGHEGDEWLIVVEPEEER